MVTEEQKRKFNKRKSEIKKERQQHESVRDNAGVIDQATGMDTRSTGEKMREMIASPAFLMSTGMVTSVLGNNSPLASGIGGGLSQGGAFGGMLGSLGVKNPYMMGAAIGVGALQGSVQGYKDTTLNNRQEDTQRNLTESTKRLTEAFNIFHKSGNIEQLREVWGRQAEAVRRSMDVELQRQQSLTGCSCSKNFCAEMWEGKRSNIISTFKRS